VTEAQIHRITVGDLVLDTRIFEATRAGRAIVLTSTEYRVLRHLMRNHGRVLAKSDILREVWGRGQEYNLNLVEAIVSGLRKKIDKGQRPMIHTRRGFGYVLRAADTAASGMGRENRFATETFDITGDISDDDVREIAARLAGLSRQSQRELLRTADELYKRDRRGHIAVPPQGQTA
jgi:DNA-binding winged helix-turn-helix (wHTH) protein